ncbi:MAG: NAD(+)--dinitrogen-reductase ADP-D-ribosyltransferase [Pseudomonadota bacterium]
MNGIPLSETSIAARGHSTNLVGVPTGLLANAAFNDYPLPLHISGTRESHRGLFNRLRHVDDPHEASRIFQYYMNLLFSLDELQLATGNLLTTTDPAGNVTRLTYDARGRKVGMNDPDMGIWTYAYNALGELIRQVDAKGQTVTMTYDKLGRMLSRNEPDLISTWVYDTAANGKGKLASSNSSNGYSRTHTYDALGRPTGTTTIPGTGEAAMVVSVTYDGFGRVLTQTYPASPTHPAGFTVSNTYNADGYLTGVGGFWAANSMDAMGHLTQQTYGNGVVTTQVFDPDTGKLKQQLAGVGNAVQNTSYKYDSLGNLKTRVDAVNGLTETYSYDNLNRILTAASLSGAVNTLNSYSYNAIGNIVGQSKKDVTAGTIIYDYAYTYNTSGPASIRPHAVSAITGTVYGVTNPVYTYDANGSMLTGAGRNVIWTSFNMPAQMVGCPNGGATCSTVGFTYNPEHERVKETQADGSVVITLSPRYDTGLHFEKKTFNVKDPQTGALIPAVEYEHYLCAGGMMFGKYITTTTPAGLPVTAQNGTVLVPVIQTEYYTKDHLGSIVAITDQTGAVTQRLSFDVFGKRRYPNGAADPNGLLNNPDMYHGYTGHEMLDAVGLIHMNGRIFDPAIGRFLSADPSIQAPGNIQSYNRYTYGWNNPYAGTDPSGFSWWTDVRGIVIRVVAAVADAYFCSGYCSAAVGAYEGYKHGGVGGAVVGGVAAYVGYQVSLNYPLTDQAGAIVWQNVAIGAATNAVAGCVSAEAGGGRCGQGALQGAVSTVGSAFGFTGAVIAGCAAGKIGGGSCREGALNAVGTYAAYSAIGYIVQSQRVETPSPQDQTYAKLASGVYDPNFNGADGYVRLSYENDIDSGFQAALFVKGDHYVLAFAGTDPGSWANWKANFTQAFGGESVQYTKAMDMAVSVHAANTNVTFVGHSLGGGLASAAATVTGGAAVVFNAAGLHPNTTMRANNSTPAGANVTYYYSALDVLRVVNAFSPASVPGRGVPLGAAGFHGMGGVCKGMGTSC